MASISRASGLQITLPDDYQLGDAVAVTPPRTRRINPGSLRGAIPLPPSAGESDPLLAALEQQEMRLFDQFDLTPSAAPKTRAATTGRAAFDVPLAANEDAVLLLEQDGMYTWQFPDAQAAPRARGGQRGPAPARQATFSIDLPGPAAPAAPTRGTAKRGIVSNFVWGTVKGYVLKFAARIAVGNAIKYLERNVRTGLVNLAGDDPQQWPLVSDLATLKLPADRPARLLLFIHGTFSSTIGGFGALAATPWGQKFLAGARANYDAVIGFDHQTLSEDPLANATELLKQLQGYAWPFNPQIDIITHSRGGLVTRSLIEHLLPLSPWKPQLGRVIFVAATNGGTLLAEPANWKTLVDLYTNLVVGACKLLKLLPQVNVAALVLSEAVQSLGAFVKYAATHTISDSAAPGLAAMEPAGAFVTKLNETQPGQPTIQQSNYFAITAQFKAQLDGDHQPSELPKRLLQMLGTGFMSELMKEANDLVVNTASMIAIDPQAGKFIKDSLDFSANPQVYHTNYFVQPRVTDVLARWLGLLEPRPASPPSPAVTRGGRRGIATDLAPVPERPGALAAVAAAQRIGQAGEAAKAPLPAAVDTDIIVVDADVMLAAELRQRLETQVASFVVLRRAHYGDVLNYAFTYEQIFQELKPNDQRTLSIALGLREEDASQPRTVNQPLTLAAAPQKCRETAGRGVVIADGRPVGVVAETVELRTTAQLVALAQKLAKPTPPTSANKPLERAEAQRAMPTFLSLEGLSGYIGGGGVSSIVPAGRGPRAIELPAARPRGRRAHHTRRRRHTGRTAHHTRQAAQAGPRCCCAHRDMLLPRGDG
ncbi:MAG: hypothetical protein HYR56_30480 [Acidobacteria bacterium]|nr:hypothetical protein [Acidobacteriota bacterium]